MDIINNVRCEKLLVEFLRVNTWVKKWFDIDYSEYTLKQSGYEHLPLMDKIGYLRFIDRTKKKVTVCEDVSSHYEYWREHVNPNREDCCNLSRSDIFFDKKEQNLCIKEIKSVYCGRNMVQEIEIGLVEPNMGQVPGLPRNPRGTPDEIEIQACIKSLEEDPELMEARTLLVVPHEGKYVVLGGNLRLEALRRMGCKKVWCDICDDLTPQEMKEFVIKDNTQFGSWDMEALADGWDDLPLNDLGVEEVPESGSDEVTDAEGSKELDTSEYDEQMQIVFRFDETEGGFMKSQLAGLDAKSEIIRRLNDES